jgi:hypothetical protein
MLARTLPTSTPSHAAPPSGMRTEAAATLGAFLALAVLWTWPLAAHRTTRIPYDPGLGTRDPGSGNRATNSEERPAESRIPSPWFGSGSHPRPPLGPEG